MSTKDKFYRSDALPDAQLTVSVKALNKFTLPQETDAHNLAAREILINSVSQCPVRVKCTAAVAAAGGRSRYTLMINTG